MKTFLKGIMAGVCISLGGWLFLYCGYKTSTNLNIIGAFMFPIGLVLICNLGYYLYTGKICYLFTDKTKTRNILFKELGMGILGNFIGCLAIGTLLRYTTVIDNTNLLIYIDKIINNKINYQWYEMITMSFFCGMLVYFAVDGFKKSENIVMKNLFVFIFISTFILCGFEHCVANMFYYAVGSIHTINSYFSLALCIIGNTLGGLFVPFVNNLIKEKK